jgi:hypothetical protein
VSGLGGPASKKMPALSILPAAVRRDGVTSQRDRRGQGSEPEPASAGDTTMRCFIPFNLDMPMLNKAFLLARVLGLVMWAVRLMPAQPAEIGPQLERGLRQEAARGTSVLEQRRQAQLANDGHRQKEMMRIILQRDESVTQVELAGGIVDRIHLNGSQSDVLGKMLSTAQGVNQEKTAQAFALLGSVNGEPAQKHDRHVNVR